MASGSDSFNGWSNRETWAVALYINNDEGWQSSVIEALEDTARRECGGLDACNAASVIRENVEQMLETQSECGSPAQFRTVRDDMGSLWRVDWDEIAGTFHAEVNERVSAESLSDEE